MLRSRTLSVVGRQLSVPRAPWLLLTAFISSLLVLGCSSGQVGETTPNPSTETTGEPSGDEAAPSESAPEEPPSNEAAPPEASTQGEAACRAYENDSEVDPLRRWVPAFPLRTGGVVSVFTGPSAEQMEVELVLEMAGIVGYEDYVFGTAVVVWIPGFECEGEGAALARRIEEGTTMSHLESACFRMDEVRGRLREECESGRLAAELCQ